MTDTSVSLNDLGRALAALLPLDVLTMMRLAHQDGDLDLDEFMQDDPQPMALTRFELAVLSDFLRSQEPGGTSAGTRPSRPPCRRSKPRT